MSEEGGRGGGTSMENITDAPVYMYERREGTRRLYDWENQNLLFIMNQ
jgi:hypothetical protein